MKKEDVDFRKNCQLYRTRVRTLLRKGKAEEAQAVINEIQLSLIAWEEYIKSGRFKINVLKSLFTQVTVEQRTFIKKAERRRQDND